MRTLVEEFFHAVEIDDENADELLLRKVASDARIDAAIRRYEVDRALDSRSAPQPGGPWVVGGWNDMTPQERIGAMTAAKTGGAFADAVAGVERGYAIGDFGG